jgi:hypothetical protein
VKKALLIENLRKELESIEVEGSAFVLFSAQVAPVSLVGLIADGKNYLEAALPMEPGKKWIVVPLDPTPRKGSEIWWAALPAVTIPGLAAVLIVAGKERLLKRTESAPRGVPWSDAKIV